MYIFRFPRKEDALLGYREESVDWVAIVLLLLRGCIAALIAAMTLMVGPVFFVLHALKTKYRHRDMSLRLMLLLSPWNGLGSALGMLQGKPRPVRKTELAGPLSGVNAAYSIAYWSVVVLLIRALIRLVLHY